MGAFPRTSPVSAQSSCGGPIRGPCPGAVCSPIAALTGTGRGRHRNDGRRQFAVCHSAHVLPRLQVRPTIEQEAFQGHGRQAGLRAKRLHGSLRLFWRRILPPADLGAGVDKAASPAIAYHLPPPISPQFSLSNQSNWPSALSILRTSSFPCFSLSNTRQGLIRLPWPSVRSRARDGRRRHLPTTTQSIRPSVPPRRPPPSCSSASLAGIGGPSCVWPARYLRPGSPPSRPREIRPALSAC